MGRHMNTVEQTTIWDRYGAGDTFTEVARSVGRSGQYGTGLCGPSRVPSSCGAACLVVGTDVVGGPRRDISGLVAGRVVSVYSASARSCSFDDQP